VNGYLITFGGLLLLASRAGDLYGRRRIFLAGLVVFSAASLAGGLAQQSWVLLAARLVQGAGAAALAPSGLSLITTSHTEPAQRNRAMTWWGVAASTAGAVGIVLGGLLTASLSWRWVMLVNVPIGVGLIIAALTCLAPSAARSGRTRNDVPGAVTVTLAAAAIVYGVSEVPVHGWGSAPVLVSLVAGVLLGVVFLMIEGRKAEPLIPLDLFAERNVRLGNILTVCLGVVIIAPLFFLSLYLQQGLGQSALRTGLALLPMSCVIAIAVLSSQRLIPRINSRSLVASGAVVTAAGLVWLAQLPAHSAYLSHVLGPSVVVGAGTGVMMMPVIVAATTGIHPRNAGVASGVLNVGRQLGAALGLAVLVTVAASVTAHHDGPAPVVAGYHAALLVLAAVSLLTAPIALLLNKSVKRGGAA
jgi:EmrB/QacA subfamily drug resistance transporter